MNSNPISPRFLHALLIVIVIVLNASVACARYITDPEGDEKAVSLTSPSVNFVDISSFGRFSNQVSVLVHANDPAGLTRIDLLAEQTLIGTVNILAGTQDTAVYFSWDTTTLANGKHLLQVKAFNSSGAAQSAFRSVIVQNFSIATPTGNQIALNPYVKYQTMKGWEAVAEAAQLYSPAWNNYKDTLFDQAVNDLGINRVRLEIISGTENPTDHFAQWRAGQISESQYNARRYEIINDDGDPNHINPTGFKWSQLDSNINNIVLPLRQRLQARGESLWVNLNYVDFGSSTFEHKGSPNEYAEFVLATYLHMQSAFGFVPDSWEVVLEPDTSTAAWTASQVAQAIKAAGDKLAANGFAPSFTAPSTTNASNAPVFIDQIAATPGAMPYVKEFSYHRYCCASDTVLQQISDRAVRYGKQAGMLEWIGADYNTLHQDIKQGRNSSWQQFVLAGPTSWGPDSGDRYYVVDDSVVANPVVSIGSRTKFLRQYFRFVRSGAQRIQALSGNVNFDPLAFINANGKYAVVVKAAAGGSFDIQGLPAGTYGIKYTTVSQYDVNLADVSINGSQNLSAAIPAAGVITIYAR